MKKYIAIESVELPKGEISFIKSHYRKHKKCLGDKGHRLGIYTIKKPILIDKGDIFSYTGKSKKLKEL